MRNGSLLRIPSRANPPAPRAVFALHAHFTYRLSAAASFRTPTAWIGAPLTHFSPQSPCLAGSSVTQIAYAQTTHLWQRYNYHPFLTAAEASERAAVAGGGRAPG